LRKFTASRRIAEALIGYFPPIADGVTTLPQCHN